MYIKNELEKPIVIILYMDDLVIRGKNLDVIHKVKLLLLGRFEMIDMDELHYFLGIEVIQTPVGIVLSQRHYILNLLYKFGMTECKPVSTPFDQNLKLDVVAGT